MHNINNAHVLRFDVLCYGSTFMNFTYIVQANFITRIILCMRPANERRRYNVTSSLIG